MSSSFNERLDNNDWIRKYSIYGIGKLGYDDLWYSKISYKVESNKDGFI